MKYRPLMLAAIASTLYPLGAISGSFDEVDIKVIRNTAVAICDTVKEHSGSSTQLQLEGDVSGEVKGLAKSLLDAGASLSAQFTEEKFEGLSRDALALALQGDQLCRERVFLKMFDTLSDLGKAQEKDEHSLPVLAPRWDPDERRVYVENNGGEIFNVEMSSVHLFSLYIHKGACEKYPNTSVFMEEYFVNSYTTFPGRSGDIAMIDISEEERRGSIIRTEISEKYGVSRGCYDTSNLFFHKFKYNDINGQSHLRYYSHFFSNGVYQHNFDESKSPDRFNKHEAELLKIGDRNSTTRSIYYVIEDYFENRIGWKREKNCVFGVCK